MDSANPSAQTPANPAAISAQVCRQLTADYPTDEDTQGDAFAAIADAAVQELWGGRVNAFVPVLALRQAREVLREQGMELRPR